ncbi:MAG TPA: lipocalin family protein [Chitinophagaceae bacterium]|nr:lipocalin family protein [Chitinophagaceae bacterium]
MTIRKTLACVVLAGITIVACQKSNNSQNDVTILTSGKWQISDASVTIPGSGVSLDVYDSIPDCVKDNFYIFASEGTATIDEGATKCDSSDPQTTTGNWKLLENNTKLQTIDPLTGASADLTLLEINSNDMKVQDTATYQGYSVNATVTFKHIN